MRRLLTAALAWLVVAAPVAAQEDPEEGTVVARHGSVELRVYDEGRDLCVSFGSGTTCGGAPDGRFESNLRLDRVGDRTYVGGAVPAGTASVEVEFARGGRARADAVTSSAYEGRHRDTVAFFIVETTGQTTQPDEDPVLLRRFDAAGGLIGAAEGGFNPAPVAGPLALLRRAGTTVAAEATRELEPSLLRIDRVILQVCLTVRHAPNRDTGRGACAGAGPAHRGVSLHAYGSCGRGTAVAGLAAPQAATVELTLGSGRRVRVATRDMRQLGTPARAVAVLVSPDEAVRNARALDASGATLDRQSVGASPAGRRCARGSSSSSGFGVHRFDDEGPAAPADGQQIAATAPGARLVVRDEIDDHVCVGIDRLAANRHDCVVPPPAGLFPASYYPEYAVDADANRTAVGGIVPPDAAGVRVVLDGRRRVDATVSEGGEYSGRYRGHVRFFLARAPGRHRVTALEVLDRSGRVTVEVPGVGFTAPAGRTLAGGRGWRVVAARYVFPFRLPGFPVDPRVTCFGLAIGGEKPSLEDCEELADGPVGRVGCSPRVGVLMGRLAKGLRGVQLSLAGGGTLRARNVPVPRRLGGGRLWVVAIPRKARVVRMRFLGRRARERHEPQPKRAGAYAVAPPARQCGYALPQPGF
jgi:hypothetical protein